MSNLDKTPAEIFVVNLAAITGDGALVKLNMVDNLAMQKRFKLVESRGRKVGVYTSAVLVYFCNVLESKGFAKDHQDKVPATVGVADILTTAWVLFDSARTMKGVDVPYRTIEELSKWLDIKLAEVFSFGLDTSLRPTGESLKYILEDFERVSKVSDTLFPNY